MSKPSAYIVRCPGCGAANRIPADRIGLAAKCGKCRMEIPTDEKSAQPEESFKLRCVRCGAKNRIPHSKLKAGAKSLSEHESKNLLRHYGIPVTGEAVATSSKEAAKIADMMGYPVALKVDSPDIIHKTEAGAIKLSLRNSQEVLKAYDEVITNSMKYTPNARIKGVLVQEMIEDAREVIIGISIDPQFGPTIMFGLGGVFVEVLKDVSFKVPPLSRPDAEDMIKEVKGHEMLKTFRGKPEADINAIIDVLLKVSKMALDLGDIISEIDINPLMVMNKGKGVKTADALVLLK